MNQVVLDITKNNVAALVQASQYGANITIDTTTMVYYIIKFLS